MSRSQAATGPICTALGCRGERATVVIDHPDHGQRPVCDDCADGYDVVQEVGR